MCTNDTLNFLPRFMSTYFWSVENFKTPRKNVHSAVGILFQGHTQYSCMCPLKLKIYTGTYISSENVDLIVR